MTSNKPSEERPSIIDVDWSTTILGLAYLFAAAAPVAGWMMLAELAGPGGFIGSEHFEETALYQTSALAVFVLGLLIAVHGLLERNMVMVAGSSGLMLIALLLEVGHFSPDSILWYTTPLGAYLVAISMYAPRLRGLSNEMRQLIEPFQAAAAAFLMGPALLEAWRDDGWPYMLLLLVEGLVLIAIALVQRWTWLLATATAFVVLASVRYLASAAAALPVWSGFAIAGLLALSAGTAILFGRDRWTEWQRSVEEWWKREPLGTDGAS
jgi:hypothetical protein